MNNLYSTGKQEKQSLYARSPTNRNSCYGTMEHESRRSAESGFAPEDTEMEMAVHRTLTSDGVHLPSTPSWQWPIRLFKRFILRQPAPHSNAISTTKYTILTFLPKNLFEQFHRYANIYFLLIVILSLIPAIEVFAKEVAPIPLLFVLSVTAVKDIFEDYSRYRSDKTVNNRPCSVYNRWNNLILLIIKIVLLSSCPTGKQADLFMHSGKTCGWEISFILVVMRLFQLISSCSNPVIQLESVMCKLPISMEKPHSSIVTLHLVGLCEPTQTPLL